MPPPLDAAALARLSETYATWKELRDKLRDGLGDGLSTVIAEEHAHAEFIAEIDAHLPFMLAAALDAAREE